MREIKFRAWDKKYKCFVGLTAIRWLYNRENNPETLEFAGYSLGSPYSQSENIEIMQYTGLKDKNGKEIYEGDVVRYILGDNYENTGEVIWLNENNFTNFQTYPLINAFVLHSIKYKRTDTFQGNESEFLEVIGNIYEGENK